MNSRSHIKSDAGFYSIPCKDCQLKYIGEIARNINKLLSEPKRNIRLGNLNNALFLLLSETDHNFDSNAAMVLAPVHNNR